MPEDPAPAPAPEPRQNADQDRQIEADLSEIERILTNTLSEPEALALLTPIEFGPDALDGLFERHAATREAYATRARAMAAHEAAVRAKDAQEAICRADYSEFRRVARARYRDDEAAHTALALNGSTPKGLDPFLTRARGSYDNAGQEPYATDLGRRGYTPERRTALLAGLQALIDAREAQQNTAGRALEATRTRDAAMSALRVGFAEFRDTARPILEDHPELLRRIGL
jgi:hypothetical protein